MSKSILIIDTPEDCYSCNLCKEDNQTYRPYCSIVYRDIFYTPEKPDWCPLRPLPEKYDIEAERNKPHDRDYDWEFESGYNVCLDEILGK